MNTGLRWAVQLQIMPEDTLNTILMIAGKHNTANDATGIYRHPRSKQIVSNTTAQANTKQQSVPTQTNNFGHAQNPPHQDNHNSTRNCHSLRRTEDEEYCEKGGHFASNCNQKQNNHSQFGRGNHPRVRCFERGAPKRAFRTEQELDNFITSISSNRVTPRGTE
jgi:hypothetical protein